MLESLVNSESNRVDCMVNGPQSTIPILAHNSLTNNTPLEESVLNNDQNKRKMENIHSGGR